VLVGLPACFISAEGIAGREVDDGSIPMLPSDARADASADVPDGMPSRPDADLPMDARPPVPGDWWNEEWIVRHRVDLSPGPVGSRVEGVPAVIQLDVGSIEFALAGESGRALRAVSSEGERLDVEIEAWSDTQGARLWLLLPVLDPADPDPHFWIYLDNPEALAPSGEEGARVWDEGFMGVYHLERDVLDSTSNAHDGSDDRSGAPASARLTGGRSWDSGDAFRVADASTLAAVEVTLSAWVRPRSRAHHHGVLSKRVGCGGRANYALFLTSSGRVQFEFFNGQWRTFQAGEFRENEWLHVSASFTASPSGGGQARIYLNGEELGSFASPVGLIADSNPIEIAGNGGCGGDFFEGDLDEVRLSRIARSSEWIRAQHHAMTSALVRGIGAAESIASSRP